MKKILILGLATLATAVALAQGGDMANKASSGNTMGKATDGNRAITKLERDWVAAMNKKDDAAVAKILSDARIGVNPDGSTADKAKFLSEVKDAVYRTVKLETINVKMFGNTAVATGKAADPKAGNAMYMDVFVREGGSWKAVATQVGHVQ